MKEEKEPLAVVPAIANDGNMFSLIEE